MGSFDEYLKRFRQEVKDDKSRSKIEENLCANIMNENKKRAAEFALAEHYTNLKEIQTRPAFLNKIYKKHPYLQGWFNFFGVPIKFIGYALKR